MKKISVLISFVLLLATVMGCSQSSSTPQAASGSGTSASASPENTSTPASGATKARYSMGSGGTGGAKAVFIGGIATLVSKYVDNIELVMESSSGSAADLELMIAGEMEMCLSDSAMAYVYYNERGFTELRSLFGSYPSQFVCVTRDKNIQNVTDLAGKVVAAGPIGGTPDTTTREILSALGIEAAEIVNMDFSDCFTAVGEGKVDAMMGVCGNPASAILEAQTTFDLNWVHLTEEQMAAISSAYPYYVEASLPEGMYEGYEGDYEAVGVWMGMYANSDVPDEVIYNIMSAIMEHNDELVASSSNATFTTMESFKAIPIPLHPGAIKYYEDHGITVPDSYRSK